MTSRLRQAASLALVTGLLLGLLVSILSAPLGAAPTTPPAIDLAAPRVPGEALVRFRREVAHAAAVTMIERLGGQVQVRIPAIDVTLVKLPEAGLAQALDQLNSNPGVEFAEPNYVLDLADIFIPNDPDYTNWQKYYLERLELPAAWTLSTGDPSTVIAIVDTGIDMNHPDLAGAVWLNPDEIPGNGSDDDHNGFVDDVWGWDFASSNNNPADDHGHGTHVAGIVAARTNNGKGIAGIAGGNNGAGGARVMAVKVFRAGIGSYATLIQGIIYAVNNGARIINLSLGAYAYSRAEEAAVNYAWERGAVLVGAAGNGNRNYIGTNYLFYPAAHPAVVGVSATDQYDHRASFSNYGAFISVAAPGVSIYSTLPKNNYGWKSGTSMSTPHVSGLAALVWARNPRLTNAQVRKIIEDSADDLGDPGWDPSYGFGRINARKALELADRTPGSTATPSPTPPPQPIWPPDCQNLIQGGSFETPDLSAWNLTGAITRTQSPAPTARLGQWAMRLAGQADTQAELWQTISIPITTTALTLEFSDRIETQDFNGWGSDKEDPHTDHFRAEFRDATGQSLFTLLRAGNQSDTGGSNLNWDDHLFPLAPADVRTLRSANTVQLYFYADNNAAPSPPTTFYVDGIRLCAGRCIQAGDLNADGTVDLVDIMQAASHWPARSGDALYDPQFDLDGNGQIDVLDVMQVAAHWGEGCF